jgi:uncharacterized protein (DUF427 family)
MESLIIHNPENDAHFMRIRPVGATVRVSRSGSVLAASGNAVRVIETGRDVYDPVIYIPQTDVTGPLEAVAGKSTHCPLKGDASYFSLDGDVIAWTYNRALPWAEALRGHIAFYADKVAIEEVGKNAG